MYVSLTKIEIDKGCQSSVPVGFNARGTLYITPEGNGDITFDDIKEGCQGIFVNGSRFIKTSSVTEILERTDETLLFRTTTSTYRLKRS